MAGPTFRIIEHQNIRVVVDDVDTAAEFYGRLFGALEMQRHLGTREPALTRWFGESPESLAIDICITFVPEVMTLEFYRLRYANGAEVGPAADAHTREDGTFQGRGLAPQGIVVDDIDAAYEHFSNERFGLRLSGPPLRYSPLQEGQTDASTRSAAYGNNRYLSRVIKVWEQRVGFHFSDPLGLHWSVSNNVP